MLSENDKSMLILIYKKYISNYEAYCKTSMSFKLERMNSSIVKLIKMRKGSICNKCFINVTNNSKLLI